MRPGAIITVAILFLVAIVALLLGTKGYEKIEEIHTMESRVASVREQFPDIEHISTDTLNRLIEANTSLLIVDVRSMDEFNVSHIPTAQQSEKVDQIAEMIRSEESKYVVLYGSTGLRSAGIAEDLRQRGVENVRNLAGSIFAWANEGRELVDSEGRVVETVDPGDRREDHLLEKEVRASVQP